MYLQSWCFGSFIVCAIVAWYLNYKAEDLNFQIQENRAARYNGSTEKAFFEPKAISKKNELVHWSMFATGAALMALITGIFYTYS